MKNISWVKYLEAENKSRCHQQLRPYNTKHRHTNQSPKHHTTTNRSSPDITTVSTYHTTGHRGQLKTPYHLTTYPPSPQSTYNMTMTIDCNKTDEHLQTTRKPTGHNFPKTQESAFTQTTIPINYNYSITLNQACRQRQLKRGLECK